jgi:hypothetical protein
MASGGDLTLATLWVPVMPETSKIGEALREAGEKGRRGFQEGFGGGGQHGQEMGSQLGQGMIQGLEKADVPGAFEPIMNQITGKQSLMIGGTAAAVTAGLNLVVGGIESMVELVEKGAETIIEQVEHIGEAWEAINDQLAEFSTNPLLSGDAQRVLENLDAPATKLGEDLALLNSRLGLSGDALDAVSKHVEILRDRLGGLDTDALTQGMNQFNVASGDVDDTLGLLVEVQQRFGTSVDTIVGQIARESEALQDLGLSYQQSVFMLGELDAKNKAAGDGVSAMIAMSEKHAAAHHETIQQYISDELAAIEHYHQVGRDDLANQEAMMAFGARRWKDARDFAQAYFDTLKQDPNVLQGHAASVDNLAERTHHLAQAMDEFQNHLLAAFGPTAAGILESFTGGLDSISAWFDTHQTEIIGKIKDWGDTFIGMIPDIREALVDAGRLFVDFGAVAVIALEPITMALAVAASSVLLLTTHLQDALRLMEAAANLPVTALNAASGANSALDKLENLPIDTGGMTHDFNSGLDRAGRGPDMPGPDSTVIQGKAKDANKSPQEFIDSEKAIVKQYVDSGRLDLAEKESQSAFGMHYKDVLGSEDLPDAGAGKTDDSLGGGDDGTTIGPGAHTSGYTVPTGLPQGATPVVLASKTDPIPTGKDPHADHPSAPKDPPHTRGREGGGGAKHTDEDREIRDRQDHIDEAQDSLDDANTRVTDAKGKEADTQQKLTDATTAASDKGLIPGSATWQAAQDALKKATDEHTDAERAVTRALHGQLHSTHHLQDAQDDAAKPLEKGKDSGQEGGPASDFGAQFLGGMMSDLGLGNVLGGKSPLQFGGVKLGLGAANWALGAAKSLGLGPFKNQPGAQGPGQSPGTGEHVTGPATQPDSTQPSQPGVLPENVTPKPFGPGIPTAQIPRGVQMAGMYRPASYSMPGPSAGSSSVTTAAVNQPAQLASSSAPVGSGPQGIASQIYNRVVGAGYSPQVGTAAVAAAQYESGLNPSIQEKGGSDHWGLFQEQGNYAGAHGTADDQINWFINELGSQGGPSAANADPANFIANHVERGGYSGGNYNLGGAQALISGGGGVQSSAFTGGRQPYGMPQGTNIPQGGNKPGGAVFPPWVYAAASQFNLKPSTYPGHQETGGVSGRIKSGQVAPNPDSQNRGIDWMGSQPDMDRFATYLMQNGMAEQVIHSDPTTGQTFGFPGGVDYSGNWGEESTMVHTRFSQSLPVGGDTNPMGPSPGNINPMIDPQHQGSGAAPGPLSAAPNIAPQSPQNNFASRSLGGIGDVLAALNQDWNPKHSLGILQEPGPRQSAVHYDNSIHLNGTSTADPNALMQAVQEKQNSRFLTNTGGLPQGGVGSP